MTRLYCTTPLSSGAIVPLSPETSRHIHVLRLRIGDPLTLFDGSGGEYQAHLTAADRKSAEAEVLSFLPREAELPYAVTLAQALPEASKMDWIVEKAVELGATVIQPLAAQRSVVKLSGERADKRIAHWQRIVISACEQCGRNRLARVAEVADFNRWIAQPDDQPRLLLSPRADMSLAGWARINPPQPATILIGPEGGFSQEEEEMAIARGALPVSMGSRVLRTETAGMAALATLNAVWEET